MASNHKQVKLRLPVDLVEQLRFIGAQRGESLTATINTAVEAAVGKKRRGDPLVKSQLRIPLHLHVELRSAARKAGRSLNGEIVQRLRESFH